MSCKAKAKMRGKWGPSSKSETEAPEGESAGLRNRERRWREGVEMGQRGSLGMGPCKRKRHPWDGTGLDRTLCIGPGVESESRDWVQVRVMSLGVGPFRGKDMGTERGMLAAQGDGRVCRGENGFRGLR